MAASLGVGRACLTHTKQPFYEKIKPVSHLKHQGSVDRILARGSPVDELLRVTLDLRCEHAYQGNRGCASHGSLTIQGYDIEEFYPALDSDGGRGLLWNDANASFRAGKRGLKCEHPPHVCLGRKC